MLLELLFVELSAAELSVVLVLLELSETLLEVSLPHPDNKSMLIDRDTISKDLILNFIKKTS